MSALPFVLGVIFGGTVMAFIAAMGDRQEKLVRDMRARIRSLREEGRIDKANATRNLELMLDWRVKALNAGYALESLQSIYSDPICRHECEVRLGETVFDSLPLDAITRRVA